MSEESKVPVDRMFLLMLAMLTKRLGPKEKYTIHSVVGFEMGGPPDLLVFRQAADIKGVVYVTSDLIWCEEQPRNSAGRYEVALAMPEENPWAERMLAKLARETLERPFDVGHTVDVSAWVEPNCIIKGFFVTRLCRCTFEGESYGVMLFVGVTQAELEQARSSVAERNDVALRLNAAGAFPVTSLDRKSVV